MVDVPGNNTTTETVVIDGVARSGDIGPAGDHDWYAVTLVAGQTYVFATNPTSSGALTNSVLALRNSAGTQVAFNDDRFAAGGNTHAGITYTAPSSGTYYLDVSGSGSATGNFLLSAARLPAADIAGNTGTTETLQMGTTRASTISANDSDWFKMTLTAGQRYTFAVEPRTASGLADSLLFLRDDAGNLVAYNDDFDFSSGLYHAALTFTPTTSGTYYLDVRGFDGFQTGNYFVSAIERENLPTFTLEQIADQLITGFWIFAGGAPRRFNAQSGDHITVNITGLTAEGQFLAIEALNLWSDITGLIFDQVSSGAQITFLDDDPDAFSFSVTSGGFITTSTVNIGLNVLAQDGTTLDSESFVTYLHEIGHALGLGHAGNYNDDSIWGVDEHYLNDVLSMSVMSYFRQTENTTFQSMGFDDVPVVTPMLADVLAISMRYGSANTRSGPTTYGFNNTSGRAVYDAAANPDVGYTIYDRGGNDTLDYRGFNQNQLIDLNAEAFSNIGGHIGNVTIARGTVIENAIGGNGNDLLIGNNVANRLEGSGGNDILDGGAGNDTASYMLAPSAVTVSLSIFGSQNTLGAGTDTLISIENLIGSNHNDTLTGNAGANVLEGRGGNDTLNGGAGIDTASYISAASAVNVSLAIVGAQNTLGAGSDTLISIENLTGSNHNDTLTGNGAANVLEGRGGNDTLNGGAGIDTASYLTATAAVSVSLAIAGAQNTLGAGSDTLIAIENLTGSNHNDTLIGNAAANVLEGRLGNDTLNGGGGADTASYMTAPKGVTVSLAIAGAQNTIGVGTDTLISIENLTGSNHNDTLTGNGGANVLEGRAGNDTLDGAGGVDTASYVTATAAVNVNLGLAGPQNTLGAGSDTLISIENLTGSNHNDTLTGNSAANVLEGRGGNDTLNGAGGSDTASYVTATAGVTVNLAIAGAQNTLGAGIDTLISIENLTGSNKADMLTGNGGANSLDGRLGNDILDGAAGADSFRFTTALGPGNIDTIKNFSPADDTIRLDDAIFVGLPLGPLAAGSFVNGPTALDADDRILYNSATGALFFDRDGTGAIAPVQFAVIDNHAALTAADFVVI
jgi:Ca2+-binding RTX toxin-like protein